MTPKKTLIAVGLTVAILATGAGVWLWAAPSIGATRATPVYVAVNVPTSVLFTAEIADPSVLPTGVNLLQTDVNGKSVRTIGTMLDNGTNGDAVAGDKIFSRLVPLSPTTLDPLYYRVSAAFKGVLLRAQSSVMTLTVDPIPLPPDPGEAGKQTLAGIDSDGDGVRDDVQRWVGLLLLEEPPEVVNGVRQYAGAQLQTVATGAVSRHDAEALSQAETDGMYCLAHALAGRYTRSEVWDEVDRLLESIDTLILNTPERVAAYRSVDIALGGTIITAVDPTLWPTRCR